MRKQFSLLRYCPPTPQARSQGRDRFLPPLPASLALPSLGLWSCPHVNGFLWLISKDPAAFQRAEPSWRSENSIPHRQRSSSPTGTILPPAASGRWGHRAQTQQKAWALPASAPQPLSASSSADIFPQEHWEDAGVCSAPAPRFFFLSLLWDLAVWSRERFPEGESEGRERRFLPRRANGAGGAASTRDLSCTGRHVTEENPQHHLPPPSKGSQSARRGRQPEPLCQQRCGTGAARHAGSRVPGSHSGKSAAETTASLALGTTPGPAERGWTGSRFPPTSTRVTHRSSPTLCTARSSRLPRICADPHAQIPATLRAGWRGCLPLLPDS